MEDTTVMDDEVDDRFEELSDQAERIFNTAREKLAPVDNWVRRMAQEHPVATLLGAAGIGYVLARIVRR
jgi:hypothetical protein